MILGSTLPPVRTVRMDVMDMLHGRKRDYGALRMVTIGLVGWLDGSTDGQGVECLGIDLRGLLSFELTSTGIPACFSSSLTAKGAAAFRVGGTVDGREDAKGEKALSFCYSPNFSCDMSVYFKRLL
jgi:hypothetical protein